MVAQHWATTATAQGALDLDPSFQTVFTKQGAVSLLPQMDGKLIVSGVLALPGAWFTEYRLLRINPNGSVDNDYELSGLGSGKITEWNDQIYVGTNTAVRRILPNGAVDDSFSLLGSYFGSLQGGDHHVYPEGSLVLTGTHNLYDTIRGFVGLYNMIWFTNTGHLDTTKTHRQSNGTMWNLTELSNGRFICSTFGNTFEGQPVSKIFRTEADGSLDTSFHVPVIGSWSWSYHFNELDDGRVLASGLYRTADGNDTLSLLCLLENGDLDPAFHHPDFQHTSFSTYEPSAYKTLILADGRIIVVGDFDLIDGEPRSGIALLNANGTLSDDAFAGGGCGIFHFAPLGPGGETEPHRRIMDIVQAPDGSFYIAGMYWGYNDGTNEYPDQRIVSRLYGLNVGMEEQQVEPLQMQPNPANSIVTIQLPDDLRKADLQVHDALGRLVHKQRVASDLFNFDVSGWPAGLYQVQVLDAGKRRAVGKLVVE